MNLNSPLSWGMFVCWQKNVLFLFAFQMMMFLQLLNSHPLSWDANGEEEKAEEEELIDRVLVIM